VTLKKKQNNEMVYARRTPDGRELLIMAVNSGNDHTHVEVFEYHNEFL
jgi:hypothetical protein